MSEIIEFPTRDVVSLNRLKKQVREQLSVAGEPEDLINYICQRVEELHQEYHNLGDFQFDLALPDNISQGEAQQIVKQVTDSIININSISAQAVTNLVSEIIRLEIALYHTRP